MNELFSVTLKDINDLPNELFINQRVNESGHVVNKICNYEGWLSDRSIKFSRLDTIWHDVHTEGDEPNKCMWIIAECERDYRTVYWGSLKDCTWEEYVTHHVVMRWAYIDDLFPKD